MKTAVPAYRHRQQELLSFMDNAYRLDADGQRKLRFLYNRSGIDTRYSVIPDFTLPMEQWEFFPRSAELEPFPSVEQRMSWYHRHALTLTIEAAKHCLDGVMDKQELTHVITVSCTGMSAPGLELQLVHALGLRTNISRTAINFMGCYAAIHALKMANDITLAHPEAKVLVVCTELCSLHFQKTFSESTAVAPLLFGDGSAAMLICGNDHPVPGMRVDSFYSAIIKDGADSMTWDIASTGFIMSLSSDVPEIFHADMGPIKEQALANAGLPPDAMKHWCIHPGGKRMLEAIGRGLGIADKDMAASYEILRQYGNMSSATILFVLQYMWPQLMADRGAHTFGAAFGPGLTMESVILTAV